MKLEFLRDVVVDGKGFKAGDVVETGGESASYFESCLRMAHAQKVEDQKPTDTKKTINK